MGTVIGIANQKGGVGKTTTTYTLMAGLTKRGYKVLGIDFDPQSNLTKTILRQKVGSSIYGVLIGEVDILSAIAKTPVGDLLPTTNNLSNFSVWLSDVPAGREYQLKEALSNVADNYDYIIIDGPPSLGDILMNLLTACNKVIVPIEADMYSEEGLEQLNKSIMFARKYTNKNLEIMGVLLNKFQANTNLQNDISKEIREIAKLLNTKVFNQSIRQSIIAKELQFTDEGVFNYAPKSNIAIDYDKWISEVLEDL